MSERIRAATSCAKRPTRDSRRVVVVGPCGSGKTTLVNALRQLGYDARVSGQEHSEIAHLWERSHPEVLIALITDLESIRERRGRTWPDWLYRVQMRRLRQAFAAANLTIDTTRCDIPRMISEAETHLDQTFRRRKSVQ